jgi:hypothetical protein
LRRFLYSRPSTKLSFLFVADDNVGAATWSAVECNTGIICACLPTLRPLISKILPSFLSTLSGSRSNRRIGEESSTTPTYRNGTQTTSTIGAPCDDHDETEYRMSAINVEPLMPGMPRIARDGTIEFPKANVVENTEKESKGLTEEIRQKKKSSDSTTSSSSSSSR